MVSNEGSNAFGQEPIVPDVQKAGFERTRKYMNVFL